MKRANCKALLTGGSVFVGGVLIGMVAGAVSGFLFAPRSGEETRELLCKQATDLGKTICGKCRSSIDVENGQLGVTSPQACDTVEIVS